jgi:anti-sigma B factor antagonist
LLVSEAKRKFSTAPADAEPFGRQSRAAPFLNVDGAAVFKEGIMLIESARLSSTSLALIPFGRLDTATVPQFERKIKQVADDITKLILDFLNVPYISSVGLRVLLQTQKTMNKSGRKLSIRNMNESVKEVFEMTGFINLLAQEEKFVIIKKKEGGTITFSLIGCMDSGDVPTLKEELSVLQNMYQYLRNTLLVIFDMEKLSSITAMECKMLKAAITKTDWPRRRLIIQNASGNLFELFKSNGMGSFLE